EVLRKAVELVAGTRDGQAAAEVASHDAAACLGHGVDALQRAPPDEEPDKEGGKPHDAEGDDQRAADGVAEPLRLAEVPPDEHDHLVGEAKDQGGRLMTVLVGLASAGGLLAVTGI